MASIIKMLLALRAATGNVQASDAFMQALEEREVQRLAREEQRDAQRDAREREAREEMRAHEAHMDKIHQDNLNLMRSEIKANQRRINFIGLLMALVALTNLIVALALVL